MNGQRDRDSDHALIGGSCIFSHRRSIVVLSRTSRLAALVRRATGDRRDLRVVDTRPATCHRELGGAPASPVIIDVVTLMMDALPDWLAAVGEEFPATCFLAVVSPRRRHNVFFLREAGVAHVVESFRRLDVLIRLAYRHLERTPGPEPALVERIEASLPWQRFA